MGHVFNVGKRGAGQAGWKETQAAYRLISNDAVYAEAIAEPHTACTVHCMAAQPVTLCIQDTWSLDFNGQDIDGLGPLQYEAQRGMFPHPTYSASSASSSPRVVA